MRLVVPNATQLEAEHRKLDKEIRKIERRGSRMTPVDQTKVAELKKTKLAIKDRMSLLRAV